MATRPEAVPTSEQAQAPAKAKRKRSPSVAKPAFFVIQILDESGQPVPFDKRRVKLLKVERNAEIIMEMMDNAEYPNAFYLRGIVPVARAGVATRGSSTSTAQAA